MTPTQVQEVMSAIRARYPRLKWTDAIKSDFAFRLTRIEISVEQAEAVVSEVAMNDDRGYPQPATFLKRMKACIDPVRTQQGHAPMATPTNDEGPLRTWAEWMAHYRDPFNRNTLPEAEFDGLEWIEKSRKAKDVVKALRGAA